MFEVTWNRYAESSFSFILAKWTTKEAEGFFELVEKSVIALSKNPFLGRKFNDNNHALFISKQTTIYYRVFEKHQYIEILVFWPNLRNPDHLLKYL